MYVWNEAIYEVSCNKSWHTTLADKPENERLVLAKFDLGTEFNTYEVCKYNCTVGWYTWCADKIVSFLDTDCTPVEWMYVTEKEAYKILGINYDAIICGKKRKAYDEYAKYLDYFVKNGCKCDTEKGTYPSPLRFDDWIAYKGTDL